MKNLILSSKNYFANRAVIAIVVFFIMASFGNALMAQKSQNSGSASGQWVAPAAAKNYKNPFSGDAKATMAGKKLYKQYCVICHGARGKGDGVAGMTLQPRPSNFTKPEVQNQPDGAIYWKLTKGRSPMASYKTTLTKDQRWQLVNYIRTFKK